MAPDAGARLVGPVRLVADGIDPACGASDGDGEAARPDEGRDAPGGERGRWLHTPPKGYRRGVDGQGRALMAPNGDADYIHEAYRLAAETDRSMESIRTELRGRGFACSKNQFLALLRSPVYAGRIVIRAWGSEPEREVAGLHEPIVSADAFAAVQRRRFGKPDGRSMPRRRLVPEVPLRGHLVS